MIPWDAKVDRSARWVSVTPSTRADSPPFAAEVALSDSVSDSLLLLLLLEELEELELEEEEELEDEDELELETDDDDSVTVLSAISSVSTVCKRSLANLEMAKSFALSFSIWAILCALRRSACKYRRRDMRSSFSSFSFSMSDFA